MNLRGMYFGRWPIPGPPGTCAGDGKQLWDWYAAKPIRAGVEFCASVDNMLDSVDSNLSGTDPGRMLRIGLRWSLGA